jgi:hypothetical protein
MRRFVSAAIMAALVAAVAFGQQTGGHPNGPTAADKSSASPQVFNGPVGTPTLRTSVRPYIDVTAAPYNAKCDGTTDDTAAINAAIAAASRSASGCGTNSNPPTANCSGVVLFPNVFCAAQQIVMKSYVTLLGTGPTNSGLIQLAGSNEHFIVGTSPTADQRFTVRGLSINGNSANQTGTFDCIHFDGTGAINTVRSPRHRVDDTWAENCGQDGISIFGDAGSDDVTDSKAFWNGRYGLNLDAYDSHASRGEYFSNGTAGMHLGTHGNGSASENKAWGNGPSGVTTGTVGDGMEVNSGNWRITGLDVQDNVCNGLVVTGATNVTVSDLLLDGNGNTPNGNGCAGLVLSGVKDSKFGGTFTAHVDAGTSDYALAWVGTNTNNWVDIVISTVNPPHTGSYSGTIGQTNTFCSNTTNGCVSSVNREFLNGAQLFGFSDTGATRKWHLDATNGDFVPSSYTVATLPSASTLGAGAMLVVTDAASTTIGTCAGGGSTIMIAVSTGSAWTCH